MTEERATMPSWWVPAMLGLAAVAVLAVVILGRPGAPATASPVHEPAPTASADPGPVVPADPPSAAPIAEPVPPAIAPSDPAPAGEGAGDGIPDES